MLNAKDMIEVELNHFIKTMQGFGMRIHGTVARGEGPRDNYTITLTAWSEDGTEKQSHHSMNGYVLLHVSEQNRAPILRDEISGMIRALVF